MNQNEAMINATVRRTPAIYLFHLSASTRNPFPPIQLHLFIVTFYSPFPKPPHTSMKSQLIHIEFRRKILRVFYFLPFRNQSHITDVSQINHKFQHNCDNKLIRLLVKRSQMLPSMNYQMFLPANSSKTLYIFYF